MLTGIIKITVCGDKASPGQPEALATTKELVLRLNCPLVLGKAADGGSPSWEMRRGEGVPPRRGLGVDRTAASRSNGPLPAHCPLQARPCQRPPGARHNPLGWMPALSAGPWPRSPAT